jgi:hypothetical protein
MEPKVDRPHMPGYGVQPANKGAGLLPWSFVDEHMRDAHNYWVVTAQPDGTPHAAPVWGLWHEGAFYFSSGDKSAKAHNLAANPAAVVHLESGDQVVILNGAVSEITGDSEDALLKVLEKDYKKKYQVGFLGLGNIYRFKVEKALAWREGDFPSSATRWQFE